MQDLLILLLKLLSNLWSFFSSRNSAQKLYKGEIIYILIKQRTKIFTSLLCNKEKTKKTTKPFKSRGKITTNTVEIILTQKQYKIIVFDED